jgi:hypothetical protein
MFQMTMTKHAKKTNNGTKCVPEADDEILAMLQ